MALEPPSRVLDLEALGHPLVANLDRDPRGVHDPWPLHEDASRLGIAKARVLELLRRAPPPVETPCEHDLFLSQHRPISRFRPNHDAQAAKKISGGHRVSDVSAREEDLDPFARTMALGSDRRAKEIRIPRDVESMVAMTVSGDRSMAGRARGTSERRACMLVHGRLHEGRTSRKCELVATATVVRGRARGGGRRGGRRGRVRDRVARTVTVTRRDRVAGRAADADRRAANVLPVLGLRRMAPKAKRHRLQPEGSLKVGVRERSVVKGRVPLPCLGRMTPRAILRSVGCGDASCGARGRRRAPATGRRNDAGRRETNREQGAHRSVIRASV